MAFSWTSVLSWAVGEKIRAAKLNQAVTAIAELQLNATQLIYDQVVTSGPMVTWASNATAQTLPASSFPSASGFTASSAITVPQSGTYWCALMMQTSANWAAATRYYAELSDGSGSAIGRGVAIPGVGENQLWVTGVTKSSALSTITPTRFQNTGSSITLSSARLIVVRLGTQ